MNERWVCKRCFADNEEADGACQRCGLIRGAEATDSDRATWVSEAGSVAATPPQPGWRRSIRYWWIPALAVVLVIGYLTNARRDEQGLISGQGTLSVEDLRVGDCFNVEDAQEISQVDARPCTQAHQYEMFHLVTWTGSEEFPSEDAILGFIFETCVPEFESYVGLSYEASRLDFMPITPTEEGWGAGDRVVQCALLDPAEPELTTSLRGANR